MRSTVSPTAARLKVTGLRSYETAGLAEAEGVEILCGCSAAKGLRFCGRVPAGTKTMTSSLLRHSRIRACCAQDGELTFYTASMANCAAFDLDQRHQSNLAIIN
jgi:hypothetical protein